MPGDVREVLERAAARPLRPVDVETLTSRVRRRRGVRVAALSTAVVVVVGVAVGVLVGGGSADSSRHIGVANQQTNTFSANGVTVGLPEGWKPARTSALGEVLGASTDGDAPNLWSAANCDPAHPIGEVLAPGDAFVSVRDDPRDYLNPRPPHFPPVLADCGGYGVASPRFTDGDRNFAALVVVGPDAPGPRRVEAFRILDSFKVEPSAQPATTTVVSEPLPPPSAVATPPPTFAASSEEQQIRAAFLGWIDAQPHDNVAAYVEDAASILDSLREGMAQHTPDDLAKYSGRVDFVQIVDPTHANVRYSILWDGHDSIPYQDGAAIKVDGRWMVTRETVCALLAVGNVHCPPRS